MIEIDGSYGEGGGQVLRTAISLSTLLGEPIRIHDIRAGRRNPGLAPQHLTAVLAAAETCEAKVEGARLRSTKLTFEPQMPPQAGEYDFNVAEARKGGSAGATSLIFQTIFVPLALAGGRSRIFLRGGTHVAWSPPFHYLKHVYLPTVSRLGIEAQLEIVRWGWYPIGEGVMTAIVPSEGRRTTPFPLTSVNVSDRGELRRIWGISALSRLPDHIGERQRGRTLEVLRDSSVQLEIKIVDAPAKGRGTVVFLVAEYENTVAGFTALGKRGKPAETVAEEACEKLLDHYRTGSALDPHLADQLILPLALTEGHSTFSTSEVTDHLLTNIWVVEQFLETQFTVEGTKGHKGTVTVKSG